MGQGESGFEEYYTGLFGHRWKALQSALLADRGYVALQEGLLRPYYLDPASVAVAQFLPLDNADTVVDLCAAPGGKSLALVIRLPEQAELVANERSRQRRARLSRVLDHHLPAEQRHRVKVTGHDATRWGLHQPGSAQAILADVPCSSEQHVLRSPNELSRWSPGRVKRLAVQQFAILAAAIDALAPGGHVLYVTCALTPEENDHVIAKALKKRKDRVIVVPLDPTSIFPGSEATEHGVHILPDRCGGAGPLYCSLLQRR